MLASARPGLIRLGRTPAQQAPRNYSGLLPTRGSMGVAQIARITVGANAPLYKQLTYSSVLPNRGTLGMGRPGLARLARPAAIAAAKRPKKQTGIPLRAAWQPAAPPVQAALRSAWIAPKAEILAPRQPWASSQALDTPRRSSWSAQAPADASRRSPWAGQRSAVLTHIPARPGALARLGRARPGMAPVGGAPARVLPLQTQSALDTSERLAFTAATPADSAERLPWSTFAHRADASERAVFTAARPSDSSRRLPWLRYTARADAAERSAFSAARRADTPERFPFGARRPLQAGWGVVIEAGTPIPIPGAGFIIPIQRAYLMLHDLSVVRVADNIAINAQSLSLSLDADSAAWSWQGRFLGPDVVDAIRPDANGAPVQLAIAIDGYVFMVLVEDWTEDRTHGQRSVSAKGRGLSAQLATPYQLAASGVTASDLTLQQVLNAHLPIGSGWTIAWATGTPDWLVPAGAWSWSNQSPLNAIVAAATGVGLVVRPDMAAQTLNIQPRYPVLPWAFAAATPDIIVPDAAILSLARRNTPPSQANAAFVAGGSVGGVLARVYRDGTAGDKALAAEQHPLITHTDAARLLGSRLLAAQAQQPDVRTLQLALDGATLPLAQIGQLAEVQIGATATRGIVNALQIDAQRTDRAVTVRQSLTLGEDTPNVWAGFSRLLPQDPIRPAVVQATFSDATATIKYPDGGTERVRNPNAAAAGASVYVRGGRIDSTAPSLTQSDITV